MNVGELVTRAQRLAGRVDTNFDSRTIQFLQEAVDEWAYKAPWPTLRRTDTFVADGTRNLILPQHVLTLRWLADETNRQPIDPREQWDRQDPSRYLGDGTGSAYWWRETGIVPVTAQPGTPTQLSVRTDASDVFSFYIAGYIRDTTASGTANYEVFAEERMTVAGSGATNLATLFVRVLSMGKDDLTPGDLRVYNGSTTIGRIAANRYRSEYRNVELLTIPPAGTLLRAGYLERPNPITNIYQQPHPSINPEYLAWFAAGLIHKAMGEADIAGAALGRADAILNKRITAEVSHGDRDSQGIPDRDYWNHDDMYGWP